jgi:Bacterial protein of unknown function (DUF899)
MSAEMHLPEVVSPEEWLAVRKELLVKEKEPSRARDRVNAERRRLPMVRIDEPIDRALTARTRSPVPSSDAPPPARYKLVALT